MGFTEEELEEMSNMDLTKDERKALFKIMFRMEVDIDESARYVGWYMQMKAFGTLTFRIIHSPKSWTKARKIFRGVGIDLNELPKEPLLADRIIAVRLFKKDYPVVTDLWAVLTGVKRRDGTMRQNRKISDLT